MIQVEHHVEWLSASARPSDYHIVFPFAVSLFVGQLPLSGSATIQYDLSGDWYITAISVANSGPLEKLSIAFQFVASRIEQQYRGVIEKAISDVLWAVR